MRALSHRDAYPISFVTLRRLGKTTRDRRVRPITAAFLQYLTGAQATTSFRQRGMLLVKEMWSAVPDPHAEPPPEPEPQEPAPEEPAPSQP